MVRLVRLGVSPLPDGRGSDWLGLESVGCSIAGGPTAEAGSLSVFRCHVRTQVRLGRIC